MKKLYLSRMRKPTVIALIVLLSVVGVAALTSRDSTDLTGSEALSWKSFDEGSALALQQKKKLLIDVFTDWCTWCKKMDKDVYPNEAVKKTLTAKYIVVKLNAESSKKMTFKGSAMTEQEFARFVGVTGYPTTLFFDENLKPITSLPGYVNADKFADILVYIGDDHYKKTSYQDYLRGLKKPG